MAKHEPTFGIRLFISRGRNGRLFGALMVLVAKYYQLKHTNSANNTHQDWKIAGSVDVDLSAIHQAMPDAALSAAADKPEKRTRWRFWP
jgi:hypothetical protein